jgi:cation diffusion facilitator CzcD-associated flavoprotein CzcO
MPLGTSPPTPHIEQLFRVSLSSYIGVEPEGSMSMEHFDVIIVGAGISGIGAAVHLGKHCPDRSYVILERRPDIGGTWDLFQYPGIRSDSDMYTLGFNFKPWTEQKAIADGPSIVNYLHETVDEYDLADKIRHGCQVVAADWDSGLARWTVTARTNAGEVHFSCQFLYMCSGYYSYDAGYTPEFPGRERFKGTFVHPQHWPNDLDYAGKRVVVIGSGATAVTLVPAMADSGAGHVTMLQRTPTYMVSRPAEDRLAHFLRAIMPEMWAYTLVRWRNVIMQQWVFNYARRRPRKLADKLIRMVRDMLPKGYDVETHFTPPYNPWEQRLCLVPDEDMFRVIRDGRASVETDHIETFDETGIRLGSGKHLDADIIVSATGLDLLFLAGMKTIVDGRAIDFSQTFGYKGVMFSGVPNLAAAFGYTNASWTLKADLTSEYVCRLLNHFRETGTEIATPVLDDPDMTAVPWIDFSSGYFQRALHRFPKQGDRLPWKLHQNYAKDIKLFRRDPVDDGVLRFTKAAGVAVGETVPQLEAAE